MMKNFDNKYDDKMGLELDKRTEYLTLVNRKMELEKDAERYDRLYIQTFGDLIEKAFSLKIECIKFKKILTYAFKKKNNGEKIDTKEAKKYLEKELLSYKLELENIHSIKNETWTSIGETMVLKIKRMYKEIVNLIHPDVNPKLFENEKIQQYWHDATNAYKRNDFEDLEEVYFLLMDELELLDIDVEEKFDIDDLDNKLDKIKIRIEDIINTDPYQYKYILEDQDEIDTKKESLNDEIKTYKDYGAELLQEINNAGINIKDFSEI